jgi:hypothetical protein
MVGDPPRKVVTRYVRMITGGWARCDDLALYDMNRATAARRERFIRQAQERMRAFG